MRFLFALAAAWLAVAAASSGAAADEITDAIDQGRKAYQAVDLANAK